MKRIIALVPLVLLLISNETSAQVRCTTPCWEQSFPYLFCDPRSGIQSVGCSTNPNDDPQGIPTKAYIPGCVSIYYEFNLDTLWQPSDPIPVFTETPPDRETIYEAYVDNLSSYPGPPWFNPFDPDSDVWSDDYSAYVAATLQWDKDTSNFFAGLGWEMIDTSGMDSNAQGAVVNFYIGDYNNLFAVYDNEETAYEDSLNAYNRGTDVHYVQPWNDVQADSDAQHALDNWLGVCHPAISSDGPGCCIHVNLDANPNDFNPAATDFAETRSDSNQEGFPNCDEASCPDLYRFINVNVSPAFLYQSNNPLTWHSDPGYKLHSSPKRIWYTGTGLPFMPNIYYYGGYNVLSFYQLMEHEIGHWLGLMHPESGPPNGNSTYACPNCYTNNPYVTPAQKYNPSGFWTVMAQGNNIQNDTALLLTNEDSCQFKKLYCEEDVSVKLAPQRDNWFNPEVFPNPSNGGMTLTFTSIAPSLTQIAVYDVLGNEVKEVCNGYMNPGPYSIPLGTESLPSGNYVCRVRVGDMVSYINLAITK